MKSATVKSGIFAVNAMVVLVILCAISVFFPVSAKANYCVYYDSLNAIPENNQIFRSIRTGKITHTNDGYFCFSESGYPHVYIKESAFKDEPRNDYLTEDNLELSRSCKNAAVYENGEWWNAKRVCYYKTRLVEDYLYTQSMYRIELRVNTSNSYAVIVDAKLTSGVTFVYNAGDSTLTRRSTLPLVPSVSFVVHDGPQVQEYKVSGRAPQITFAGIMDTIGLLYSVPSCVGDINLTAGLGLAMVLVPEGIPVWESAFVPAAGKTVADCGLLVYSIHNTLKNTDDKQLYESNSIPVKKQSVAFVSQFTLKTSDQHMRATYNLSESYTSATSFEIKFGFNNVITL